MMERAKIGRYESWIEDGNLHLYCHEFGRALGFSTKMTPEETMQLMDWLASHHEEIAMAARTHARQEHRVPAHV
jgi:hypothetical protein